MPGARVVEEAFIDRGYRADGSLVPRHEPGALLQETRESRERVEDLCLRRLVKTREGSELPLPGVATLCLHGDTPAAPSLARKVRGWPAHLW
ncbi:MAG TPA: LamB/YcsF family protein [Pseudomonadota bacterium]|nr:LamB/YcsF family protein [Pseudomonadota bacterium]